MHKLWEIREGYDGDYRMGRRDKSVEEAYECGYEDGYKDAMEEIHERKGSSSYREPSMRSRDSRGRYMQKMMRAGLPSGMEEYLDLYG